MKKLFYDVETTGVVLNQNAIHQVSMVIEIDDRIASESTFYIRPYQGAIIDPEALKIGRLEEATLMAYPQEKDVYKQVIRLLSKHVDRYNKKDKLHLVGYNNLAFDDKFFRRFFERQDDPYFNAWFFSGSIDVYALASEYLAETRSEMGNFRLETVAKCLGLEVDETKTHDASYDVHLTRNIYRIITGRDLL